MGTARLRTVDRDANLTPPEARIMAGENLRKMKARVRANRAAAGEPPSPTPPGKAMRLGAPKSIRPEPARVMYSGDGRGRWVKREWAPQCPHNVSCGDRCQGVKGHAGVHWCFNPSGWFVWDVNRAESGKLKPHDIASGQTPPNHKTYRTPAEMLQHCHGGHYSETKVTDAELAARLDSGWTPTDASVTQPVLIDRVRKSNAHRTGADR